MSTRVVHPEAAGLSDGIDSLWRDVRKATTGNFATIASLENAEAALTKLLNSSGDLRQLRLRIQSELAAAREDLREAETRRALAHPPVAANSDPDEPEAVAS